MKDGYQFSDSGAVGVAAAGHDHVTWKASWSVSKHHTPNGEAATDDNRYDFVEVDGNLLMYGGASAIWERLIGTGVTAFDAANAYIGVGDSSTAAAATQTDLQAGSNKVRVGMEATYPQHSDGTGSSSNAQIVYRASFGSAVANFAWAEWGIFNASAAGRMLNRKVESHGTKASGDTWVLTCTLSLA